MKTRRVEVLDIARGASIWLVVLGHSVSFGAQAASLNNALGAFRMPFFFFIAGVVFSLGTGFRASLIKRVDALYKPFFVVVLALGVVHMLSGKAGAAEVLMQLAWGTGGLLDWHPLWFLPHLLLLFVMMAGLVVYVVPMLTCRWQCATLLLSMLAAGVVVLRCFDDRGLPFSADVALVSCAYMLLGYMLRSQVKAFDSSCGVAYASAAGFAALAVVLPDRLNFNARVYDNVPESTVVALAGIFMMLNVCWLFSKVASLRYAFVFCGQRSLFILLFHTPFVFHVENLLQRIGSPALAMTGGVIAGVLGPLVLLEIAERIGPLRMLLLPQPKPDMPGAAGLLDDRSGPALRCPASQSFSGRATTRRKLPNGSRLDAAAPASRGMPARRHAATLKPAFAPTLEPCTNLASRPSARAPPRVPRRTTPASTACGPWRSCRSSSSICTPPGFPAGSSAWTCSSLSLASW
jgi:fucose 4-O-acetylase-like acetyltransferase